MEPVLVKTVVHQVTVLTIPLTTVVQSQQFNELELASHVVSYPRSLGTLLSLDSNTHTGFFDHIDVIRPIPNSHC